MASADKVPMLEEGHRKLNDELRRLKSEERPAIVEAIEAARAHGDLSENAEYHAAKERQGHVEATIADLEDRLSRAMVIDPKCLSGDKVVFDGYLGRVVESRGALQRIAKAAAPDQALFTQDGPDADAPGFPAANPGGNR